MGRRGVISVALTAFLIIGTARAEGIPVGWPEEDYVAYLLLRDFLRSNRLQLDADSDIVCIASAVGSFEGKSTDPSERVMRALADDVGQAGNGFVLRPDSACSWKGFALEETSTGQRAMSIAVRDYEGKCGYFIDWTIGRGTGQGRSYDLDRSQDPWRVYSTGCLSIE